MGPAGPVSAAAPVSVLASYPAEPRRGAAACWPRRRSPSGAPSPGTGASSAAGLLLDWLADHPGETWQAAMALERRRARPGSAGGRSRQLAGRRRVATSPGGRTPSVAMRMAICADVVRPSLSWLAAVGAMGRGALVRALAAPRSRRLCPAAGALRRRPGCLNAPRPGSAAQLADHGRQGRRPRRDHRRRRRGAARRRGRRPRPDRRHRAVLSAPARDGGPRRRRRRRPRAIAHAAASARPSRWSTATA